jgi:LysR family transcriptional regulator, nitrogen assimilation regulatory protein
MELQQLQSFVTVAEQASFTRAAQVLGLAQPALSRHIRSLEVELRQTLLTRNGRGAVTTDAGKLLLEHARGILHQVARAQADLAQLRGGLSGRVALGLPPSVARVLTVPLTRAFRAELPDAQLTIREALSAELSEGLLNGRLDIAVLYNAQPTEGLVRQALIEEELVLVQARPPGLAEDPPPPPMSLPAVAALPLVTPSRPNAIRMHVEAEMARHNCQPQVVLEIDGVSAILDLVADGVGNALLSRQAVARSPQPSAYQLRRIGDPPLTISLSLVSSDRRATSPTQQHTATMVAHMVRTHLGRS